MCKSENMCDICIWTDLDLDLDLDLGLHHETQQNHWKYV